MLWGDVQCFSVALAAMGSGLSAAGCALDKLCFFITEHGQLRDFCVSVLFRSIIFVSFVCVCVCVCVCHAQSCSTLCHPRDCSPPGSSVHGISQARILEWVAFPFSRESS